MSRALLSIIIQDRASWPPLCGALVGRLPQMMLNQVSSEGRTRVQYFLLYCLVSYRTYLSLTDRTCRVSKRSWNVHGVETLCKVEFCSTLTSCANVVSVGGVSTYTLTILPYTALHLVPALIDHMCSFSERPQQCIGSLRCLMLGCVTTPTSHTAT